MALVSVPVRSSTGGISTAGAAGVDSAGVDSAGVLSLLEELLLPPQAVRARAMVRARIALIHLLLILSPSCPAHQIPHRQGNVKK